MRLCVTWQTRRQTQTHAFAHYTVHIAFSYKDTYFAYPETTVRLTGGRHSWADIYGDGWAQYTPDGREKHEGLITLFLFDPHHTDIPYVGTTEHDVRRTTLRGDPGH